MNSPDPDLAQAAADFRKGGWIVALLGIAGALVRLLLADRKRHWAIWVKHGIAGGLVGVIMYFALHGVEMDPLYKSVLYSSSGAVAPRLFEFLDNKVRSFLKSR